MIISNAANIPLNQNSGTLPDMSTALYNWMQKMTFVTVTKTIVNFQNVEVETSIDFQGVWQPFTPEQLRMKSEGQRSWKWFTVHSLIPLALKTDEIISYVNVKYRVMTKSDYALYGYYQYELVEDYIP